MTRLRCPYCAGTVEFDDNCEGVAHATPVCPAFLLKMRSMGLEFKGVREFDRRDVDAHLTEPILGTRVKLN